MVQITTVDSSEIEVQDDSISIIAGPYPHDVGKYTYVYSSTSGVLVSLAAPQLLIAELQNSSSFCVFQRPNGTPVWVNALSVSVVRAPIGSDIADAQGTVNAVIMIGSLHQAVREHVQVVLQILRGAGGKLLQLV